MSKENSKTYQYDAFISYSWADKAFAVKLEKALEAYKPPKDLNVPQRHLNIFRDERDLTGTELFQAIDEHLQKSAKLFVICSPSARKSENVNYEIRRFSELNRPENIIPILLSGIPNNAATPEQETEKAFPEALCEVMKMPLATNYREFNLQKDKINKGNFENSWYTILANLYGISRDEVEQRDRKRQARQRRIMTGIASGVIVALAVLAGVAWRQRNTAIERLYTANYNLARALEEKAEKAVNEAQQPGKSELYRQAWIYAATALQQQTEPDRLAMTAIPASVLFDPGVIHNTFAEKWFSPAVNFHDGSINSVAFSPDGKMLASASSDQTIRLWEVASGESRRELPGHAGAFNNVAFSPDGKMLASASFDDTIRLWEVASGESHRELKGHSDPIWSVAFSPDGKILASASLDSTIRLWEVTSGESRRELKGHTSYVVGVAFSPDGKMLASASLDGTIRLWDAASGESHRELIGHTDDVNSMAFSPDGKMLASASSDQTIWLWDLSFNELYFAYHKHRRLWQNFSEAIQFLWGVKLVNLEFQPTPRIPTLYDQDGYYFVYDKKFRPLLNPPPPGQTKFEQIFEWAKQEAGVK
jgi:hypothetical protein